MRSWRTEKRQRIEAGQRRLQQAAIDALAELQRQIDQATFQARSLSLLAGVLFLGYMASRGLC